ncbi:helix-turn-helix domain-containing protein, partial [Micromonospora zhanjiangensis]
MSKTFAGARLRRMREDRSLSQAHLARLLNISPSYLNQIEHDARPLTVPVLMRITEVFGVDPTVFAPRDTPRLVAGLREALAGRGGVADLTELATRLPELAEAVLDLHRRYRQADEQLAELIGDREAVGRSPHDRVTEFFYRRQNYVPDLDEAAERLAATVGLRRGEVRTALRDRLAE